MTGQCRVRISPSISKLFEQACLLLCHSSFRTAGKMLNFRTTLLSPKEVTRKLNYREIREGEKWKGGRVTWWEEERVGKKLRIASKGRTDEVSTQAQDVC